MKLPLLITSCCCLFFFAFQTDKKELAFVNQNLQSAERQLTVLLEEANKTPQGFPRTIDKSGKLVSTNMYDWTPGFFPGSLWYIFEFSNKPEWKQAATAWTEKLEPLKSFTQHHDLGFMMYCSFGNAYRLTGNENYKEILIQGARSLCTRFNKTTGSIKSWNSFRSWYDGKNYNYPVIVDNMMNLELLFFASRVSGDTSFRHIAITHALNTRKNQLRTDFSTYHVVCYDSTTGEVLSRETAQGYSNNSTWARGQAWGIYGFTMTYRETKDKRFLKTAEGMADFFINHHNLPADKIPYWDFNAQEAGYSPSEKSNASKTNIKPRDASAAAITASALLELSTYVDKKGKKYRQAAVKILQELSKSYKASPGTNGGFLLTQSVGSLPHNSEIGVPIAYADYYYLEALMRYYRSLKGLPMIK